MDPLLCLVGFSIKIWKILFYYQSKKLIKLNINKINTYFIRTDRNKRFYDFYKNFNFEKVKSTKNKDFYSARINSIDEKEHFISKVTF